ncbi:MAG: zinc metalloprotease HtpX [Candidatus Aenigmarchaeota archaeon]|nr:zinc metalloprotease HtpX [Candidatus Aenigmarchaeota archaeon]
MVRTALLFGLLTGILLAIGYLFAGFAGMTLFLIIAFVINFSAYWFSDRIVLSMYKAKEITKSDEPKLHEIVENLAEEAGIPKPRVYLVRSESPNAFATGRSPKNAAVAVTSGLLDNLNWDEVEGVLSHEIAHIKSRDTLTSTIAATIAGAIAYIAQMAWWSMFLGDRRRGSGGSIMLLPLIILAPLAATLVQLAISRTREYKADRNGSILSKKPLSLASALKKISEAASRNPMRGNAATSHLFIVNPFKGDSFVNLFSTHPPVAERVKRLEQMAKEI